MSTDLTLIHNCNGRFHVGMTLEEAKARGVDKCTFRRDFRNLDKNRDGVLSVNEVMNERKRDANIDLLSAIGFGACAFLDNSKAWLLFDSFVTGANLFNYFAIKNQDKVYKKMIKNAEQNNRLNVNA